MRDAEIRGALHVRLTESLASHPNTLIRHELGVYAGGRRVDVAAINGHLDGWEIKSDVDSLARLEGQIEAFSAVLDRSWLVTTDRHLSKAQAMLPEWWGLMRASEARFGGVRLTQLRRPRMSPGLDPMAVAQLLWRDEALEVLRLRGAATGLSGRARWYVWDRLASSMTLAELRATVRDRLRARRAWPGGSTPS